MRAYEEEELKKEKKEKQRAARRARDISVKLKKRKEVSIFCQNFVTRRRFCKILCTKSSNRDVLRYKLGFLFFLTPFFSAPENAMKTFKGSVSLKEAFKILRYYRLR